MDNKKRNKRVYLDYSASTPIDKAVAKVMREAENKFWTNPSSIHSEGEMAKEALEEARKDIAQILHCKKEEVYFTSGGTESANIAVLGVIYRAIEKINLEDGDILPHIITTTIEHSAILEPIKKLLKEGKVEVSFINPNEEGIVNPESIAREIKSNTVLVSVMHSNNEIGTIQSVRKISNLKSQISNPVLLVDASQSAVYEDVSIERLGADILILDGVKIYGPRGTGVLIVKNNIIIHPIFYGGGQEGGLRPGTENVVGAMGFAKALKICAETRERESLRIKKLRDYVLSKILRHIPNSSLNGSLEHRLPNNINICFASPRISEGGFSHKIDSEFLVIKLDTLGFAVSSASACKTLSVNNSSYVIESLDKENSSADRQECASSSIRITLGRHTKKSDLDGFVVALKKSII